MTKRITAKKKASRALGVNLWGRANDPFLKRNYRPGEHGTAMRRDSNYNIHLKAKQKLKKYYGNIKEYQFVNLFKEARKMAGDTAENFVGLLESRLDTIVYRANFAPTVFSSRQLVNHKHIMVNGKVVNIPSYRVKPGDVVSVKESAKKIGLINQSIQNMEREIPAYLNMNPDNMEVTYINIPKIEDVPYPIQMDINLIVEFYSK